jgi:hypothetical protein
MLTLDEIVPSRDARTGEVGSPTRTVPVAAAPAVDPRAHAALRHASALECAQLLQRFVRDPVEAAGAARVDSADLLRRYCAAVDRRIAAAGVARHGAGGRPLATLGPYAPVDVAGAAEPALPASIQMGAVAVAATLVMTAVAAALSAASSLLRHKPL